MSQAILAPSHQMSLCLPQHQVLSKKTILTHIQVVAVRVDA